MTVDPAIKELVARGWRQGSICVLQEDDELWGQLGGNHKGPPGGALVVASHDCDVLNPSLETEPTVEVVLFVPTGSSDPEKRYAGGRHPRRIELPLALSGEQVLAQASVHDRWLIPRTELSRRDPDARCDDASRRLLASWLAKRYIRVAYPGRFDERWVSSVRKPWLRLLREHDDFLQAVYLRLNTLSELADSELYRCAFLLVADAAARRHPQWVDRKLELEARVSDIWRHVAGVEVDEVEVRGADEVTLHEISEFQRFDADWVSAIAGGPTPPEALE